MNHYLNVSPYKKSFCNKHYWALKFEQGTNQPFVVCRNCDHKEKVYWTSSVQKKEILKDIENAT